jgi:3-phosphoshikimate 1-carboxyvinyltransferase
MQTVREADNGWATPLASSATRATVRLPGSKSITNRALVLAFLANSATKVVGPLRARDTELMAGAISSLGAQIDFGSPADGVAEWTVTPGWTPGPVAVNVGNAGTVLRFVPPVAALGTGDVEFTGDPRVAERPIGPLLDGLRQVGVEINDGGRLAVPFIVRARGAVRGGQVRLDASGTSQFVSGLLLAAPRFEQGVQITHTGPRLPSAPHIAMTAAMLEAAGAEVETGSNWWRVRPGELAPGTVIVEPDLSNAAPFIAAALVTGGQVTIAGWPAQSLQAATQIQDVFGRMGAAWQPTAGGMQVSATGRIRGITADLRDVNELTPVLTALAALADSPSEFTGIAHMRFHETDRLAALAGEIGALGGQVTELPDGLRVQPRPLRASDRPFDSHDDHRMVMAGAVLGLTVPGLRVHNAKTVAKTFPAFNSLWQQTLEHAH